MLFTQPICYFNRSVFKTCRFFWIARCNGVARFYVLWHPFHIFLFLFAVCTLYGWFMLQYSTSHSSNLFGIGFTRTGGGGGWCGGSSMWRVFWIVVVCLVISFCGGVGWNRGRCYFVYIILRKYGSTAERSGITSYSCSLWIGWGLHWVYVWFFSMYMMSVLEESKSGNNFQSGIGMMWYNW